MYWKLYFNTICTGNCTSVQFVLKIVLQYNLYWKLYFSTICTENCTSVQTVRNSSAFLLVLAVAANCLAAILENNMAALEKLASLGIMGDNWGPPASETTLTSQNTVYCIVELIGGKGLNWVPYYASRDASSRQIPSLGSRCKLTNVICMSIR